MVLAEPASEVGAVNIRRLGAVSVGRTAGFEIIHGLLDRVMTALAVPRALSPTDSGYRLRAADGKLPTVFSMCDLPLSEHRPEESCYCPFSV